MYKIFFISFLFFLLVSTNAAPKNPVDLYFFYGENCPYSQKMKAFLTELIQEHKNINLKEFEVFFNRQNQDFLFLLARAYGEDLTEITAPIVMIGDKIFKGYDPYLASQLRNEVLKCENLGCPSPAEKLKKNTSPPHSLKNFKSSENFKKNAILIIIFGILFYATFRIFLSRRLAKQ